MQERIKMKKVNCDENLKILNLYAGIGGNRKLWENVQVTSVEINEDIAKIYKDYFPNDKIIIGDAHKYLLEHYNEFDFIWSSPPCQSHTRLNAMSKKNKRYPDMKLYQEIIFLKQWFKGKYVIENVIPYYKVLIQGYRLDRHIFWSNFRIFKKDRLERPFAMLSAKKKDYENYLGFDLSRYKTKTNQTQLLRNCVNPKTGLHILDCAREKIKSDNAFQYDLFRDCA